MPYLQINDRYNSHNNISFNSTIADGATIRLDHIRTQG